MLPSRSWAFALVVALPSTAAARDSSVSDHRDDPPYDSYAGEPRPLPPLDPASAYELRDDTLIVLRRTACLGTCPAYSVGLRGDGTVHFYGVAYTKTLGYATATVGRPAVAALLARLRAGRFLALHNHYAARSTDAPRTVTMLRRGEAAKIVSRDGSNSEAPALEALEREIDRVAGTARWIDGPRAPYQPGTPPAIPADALAALLGGEPVHLERVCSSARPAQLRLRLSIDDFGRGRVSDWSARGPVAAAIDCVKDGFARLIFPLADVARAGELSLDLRMPPP